MKPTPRSLRREHPEPVRMTVATPNLAAERLNAMLQHAEDALQEHHLVAVSRNLGARERFSLELARHLHAMVDTQTCIISGAAVHDLESFCRQLDRALPASNHARLRRTIDGPGGVCDRLRDRPTDLASHIKHRYYIWRDADTLIRHNRALFSRLIDAFAGVAAEAEYASEDLLLLHRVVLIGSSTLDTYFNDPAGQLQSWLPDTPAGDTKPLWAVVSGLEKPPVQRIELTA